MSEKVKIPILVIVGPTATGKSALAVELARRFNGEVISADSRQVYRGLNIGTGKITRREMRGIRHHLIDVASPLASGKNWQFSAADFRRLGEEAIADIASRGKLPIIAGGTGFYIQALVDSVSFPEVPPNPALRKKLEKQSADELFALLAKKDPRRAKTIDWHNRRRLVRALEIVAALGKVPAQSAANLSVLSHQSPYDPLFIGLQLPLAELKEKILARLDRRLRHGMIAEAKRLHAAGMSSKKMEMLGLEYRALARYLTGKISKEIMTRELGTAIWHYAKRQMTWFKKDPRIIWFPAPDHSSTT